jgi:hypothetical protein
MNKIDSYNRDIAIERYIDDIVGSMHFLEVKERLKDCLLKEKNQLPNDDLEIEIMRHDPGLLTDIYIEEILQEVSHA